MGSVAILNFLFRARMASRKELQLGFLFLGYFFLLLVCLGGLGFVCFSFMPVLVLFSFLSVKGVHGSDYGEGSYGALKIYFWLHIRICRAKLATSHVCLLVKWCKLSDSQNQSMLSGAGVSLMS